MGTPCVCGVERFHIDAAEKVVRIEGSDRVLREGDVISIDGTQGIVVDGAVDLVSAELTGDLDTILSWADEIRLDETDGHANHVRVNADNPEDAALALEFGAEAIGLCRTEHMFLGDRKNIIQSFILSDDEAVKQQALADLLKVQTEDFLAMFKTMSGRDVVVRLLDPPLHEFLDNPRELEVAITKKEAAGASEEELATLRARLRRIDGMVESNPMLAYAAYVCPSSLAICRSCRFAPSPRLLLALSRRASIRVPRSWFRSFPSRPSMSRPARSSSA